VDEPSDAVPCQPARGFEPERFGVLLHRGADVACGVARAGDLQRFLQGFLGDAHEPLALVVGAPHDAA
jgi:hypothetical protein